jgi:deoxyuridine 5'-triphosphate nucleotidohydrolase
MSSESRFWPIQSEAQAYLLGIFVGSFVDFREGDIELDLRGGAKRVARLFERLGIGRVSVERGRVRLRAKRLERDLENAGLPLDAAWRLPELPDPFRNAFVRGLFDVAGEVPELADHAELYCTLTLNSTLAEALSSHYAGAEIAMRGSLCTLTWHGVNALDTLGSLYDSATLFKKSRRRCYLAWAGSFPTRRAPDLGLSFRWVACDPRAVAPFKTRVSDSGYDLTLIREVKRFGSCVLYGTGLQVAPPPGWYFDVVPRSSIIKSGYMVANSVGVIDRSYRGEVMVPLVKVDPGAPELELPARVAQMIPRPIVHMLAESSGSADTTQRGGGGFGSTGG